MIKVKIITIGHMPVKFNKKKIENWASKLFTINEDIESYILPNDSDGENWHYTDENLNSIISNISNYKDSDFTIAIINVPIQQDYYSRIIDDNLIVITFLPIKEILENQNIPLENVILRLIYAYCLGYLIIINNKIANNISIRSFTHDETKGCLFDMTGIISEVVYSCNNPQICSDCLEKLKRNGISIDKLNIAQNEIKKIKKELFYILVDLFKKHPIFSYITMVIITTVVSELAKLIFLAFYKIIQGK